MQDGYDAIEIMGMWPLFLPGTKTLLLDLHKYTPSVPTIHCSFGSGFSLATQDTQFTGERDLAGSRKKRRVSGDERPVVPPLVRGRGRRELVQTTISGGRKNWSDKMDCSKENSECEYFTCFVDKLRMNETLTIQFSSVLNTAVTEYDMVSFDDITITPYFEIMGVAQDTSGHPLVYGPEGNTGRGGYGQEDNTAMSGMSINIIKTTPQSKSKNYSWLILVSFIMGLIILGLIVIVMICCCNFCKGNENFGYEKVTPPEGDNGPTEV